MLKPQGYLTSTLCLTLAFFLLSSSIVSTITNISDGVKASSEDNGEGDGAGDQNSDGVEAQPEEQEQEGSEEEEQEGGAQQQQPAIEGDQPLPGDLPQEPPPQGNQLESCLNEEEALNPETGACEEVPQEVEDEICDNSIDDDMDKAIDLADSDCLPAEAQETGGSILAAPSPSVEQSGTWGLPEGENFPGPSGEGTEVPGFGLPSPPTDLASVPSFSGPAGSGSEGALEATESINREGMMPSTMPSDGTGTQQPPSQPSYTGPSDLVAPPSPDDPDFCLKEFGRQQLTGGTPSPQCMPGQNAGTGTPAAPTDSQQAVPSFNNPVPPPSNSQPDTAPGQDAGDQPPLGQTDPLMVPLSQDLPPSSLPPTTDPLTTSPVPQIQPTDNQGGDQQNGDEPSPAPSQDQKPADQDAPDQTGNEPKTPQGEIPGFPVDSSGVPLDFNSPPPPVELMSVAPTPLTDNDGPMWTMRPNTFFQGMTTALITSIPLLGDQIDVEPQNVEASLGSLTVTACSLVLMSALTARGPNCNAPGGPSSGVPPGPPGVPPIRKGPIPNQQPNSLAEQIVWKDAQNGGGKIAMPTYKLNDKPRLIDNYGPGMWVKMETTHKTPDGKQITVHYFKNLSTGENVEIKFKIREAEKLGGVRNPPPSVPLPPGAPAPLSP